jgi:hypothetical protein
LIYSCSIPDGFALSNNFTTAQVSGKTKVRIISRNWKFNLKIRMHTADNVQTIPAAKKKYLKKLFGCFMFNVRLFI